MDRQDFYDRRRDAETDDHSRVFGALLGKPLQNGEGQDDDVLPRQSPGTSGVLLDQILGRTRYHRGVREGGGLRLLEEEVYPQTEDNYIAAKSRILSLLSATKASERTVGGDANSELKQIQLPKINLPTFDGDQLAWEGFRDLFKSLAHEVVGLAPTQKLQYLKSSLTGEAAAAVANIAISSEGYALAWEELVSRYDNQKVLLKTHMRAL